MNGIIKRITNKADFTFILVKLEDGKYGVTYTGKQYRNQHLWADLKVGDSVEGLEWKDEKKRLLNADSPVYQA